jgi:hypothetical protein
MKKRYLLAGIKVINVKLISRFAATALALSLANPAACEPSNVFSIHGTTLFYDTTDSDGISEGHFQTFLELVKRHPDITTVHLKSTGGLVWEASRISDLIIDLGLNTHVDEKCASACSAIFLSGSKRTLALGAQLGFHRTSWTAEEIKEFYTDTTEGEDFFEFAEWLYKDTQDEVFGELGFLLERGIDARFAIKTLQSDSDDMWYPRRAELIKAGVIYE